MKRFGFLSVAMAALVLPQAASAAIVTYTNQAAFLAAISAPGTDTFSNFSITGTTVSPVVRTAGTYGYTATATNDFYGAGTVANPWLSTNRATDAINFGTFTGGVYGFGGLFFGSDINGAFSAGNIIVSVASGATTSSQTITGATTSSFLGFVSTTPLTSATVSSVQPSAGFLWPTVDNLTLGGVATVSAVPEPATWAMMIVGLGVIGASLRRRTATARARFVPAL